MSEDGFVHTSIVLPPDALERIDKLKGKYMSRSKYILKLVDKYAAEIEEESQLTKDVQGPKGSTPPAQAPPHTPTSTPTSTHAGTLEVEPDLRDMANTEGHWRIAGIVDVNR